MLLTDAGATPFGTNGEPAIDLGFQPAESQLAATPFEYFLDGTTNFHKESSTILSQDPFDFLNPIDAASIDSTIDFSAPSTSGQSLDCNLSDLFDDCYTNPNTPLDPILSALSSSNSSPAYTNNQSEAETGAKQRPKKSRVSRSNTQKSQNRKKKSNNSANNKKNPRPHYAVEKRYRTTLNENYAALTRALSSEIVQRICRTEQWDWTPQLDGNNSNNNNSGTKDEGSNQNGSRQQKTTTLSATMDIINILSRCCSREAKGLEQLRNSVQDTRKRVRCILESEAPLQHMAVGDLHEMN